MSIKFFSGFCFNKYVDNFETLNYRPILDRRKRSTGDEINKEVDVKFKSHGKIFHLKLLPTSENIFSDDHELDVNGQRNDIDVGRFLFEGYVKGWYKFLKLSV